MRTKKIDMDVMLGERYYGRLVTELPLHPVMGEDGYAVWAVDGDDVTEAVLRRFPTLRGKDFKVYEN